MKKHTPILMRRILKTTCRFYLLIIISSHLYAQNNSYSPYRLGAGVGTHISGNAHGGIYDISASLYNGKRLFSLGACVQKRTGSLCGTRLNYKYMVTGRDHFSNGKDVKSDDGLQLYFFAYTQYVHKTALSFGAVETEEALTKGWDNDKIDFCKLKLSTVEMCGGFGLSIKLTNNLVLDNHIGLSTYYHLNYVKGMYQGRMAPVLMLGTSLRFNYFN